MTSQPNLIPEFSKNNIEHFFYALTSVDEGLKTHYNNYLHDEYGGNLLPFVLSEDKIAEDIDGPEGRLAYLEIAEIARYIVERFKLKETQMFKAFFNKVEEMLGNCDDYVNELIVTGLLEDIQNISGRQVDYHFGYNQWLPPLVQLKWDALIDMWEGNGWRDRNI